MPDETSSSKDLVLRKSALASSQENSRLVARGLLAFDTPRSAVLEVGKLIALGSSVFVLTNGWDNWFDDSFNAADGWIASRKIAMYEFHRDGTFVRKVVMSLLKFTDAGYAHIHGRSPKEVTIRANFIHFYENLYVGAEKRLVRVDYLYDRTGERRAIWSKDAFVDQNRHNDEPTVPVVEWLQPKWFDGTRLIDFYARHHSLGNPPPLTGTKDDFIPYAHTSEYLIVSHDAEKLMARILVLQEGCELSTPTAIIGLSEHVRSRANLPRTTALYPGNKRSRYEDNIICDSQGLWIAKYQEPGEQLVICKFMLTEGEPQLTTYSIPHPYDLIRQEIITVSDRAGEIWRPSETDYQLLDHMVSGKYNELGMPEGQFYEFYYTLLWSSGDDLIVSVRGSGPDDSDFGETFLLFKVEADKLQVIRELDPGGLLLVICSESG